MVIGDESAVISLPGRENRTCAELQELGDDGLIDDQQCSELQPLAQAPCECEIFICSICGEGGITTDPGGIINIPGDEQGLTACAAVDQAAQAGTFNQTFCTTVQAIAEDPCGCDMRSQPTAAPTAGPSLSPEPTFSPTPRPTRAPSPPDFSAGENMGSHMALMTLLVFPLADLLW